MSFKKNESGYGLLVTLAILILVSAMGLSMLALSTSGAKRNESRQHHTQASALAEKGLKEVSTNITSELQKELNKWNGMTETEFSNTLNDVLNKYTCRSSTIPMREGETGQYGACIVKFSNYITAKGDPLPTRKVVEFESKGLAGGKEYTLRNTLELGAGTYPEALKYAVSSNIQNKNPSEGEGNLFLHGGVDITGDIKVDLNLFSYNYGHGNGVWTDTIYPIARTAEGNRFSKLVLSGNSYTFRNKPSDSAFNNHIRNTDFTRPSFSVASYKEADVPSLFEPGHNPRLIKRPPVKSPINISNQVDNFKYTHNSPNVDHLLINTNNRAIQNVNAPNQKMYTVSYTNSRPNPTYYYNDTSTFTMSGTNKFKALSTAGNLQINNGTKASFEDGLYVGGNLTIGNANSSNNDSSSYWNVEIDGPIFVKGNVIIQGVNLTSNVLLYADKGTSITYSTMKGKKLSSTKEGTFLVFSKGAINITNISVYNDTPSIIKGYFYSEDNLVMYGVGSNVRIEGGVAAKRVVLNSVRGRTSNRSFTPSIYKVNYFDTINVQKTKDSRLSIIYDPQIIESFLELNQTEPIVYNVENPLEIDREFID